MDLCGGIECCCHNLGRTRATDNEGTGESKIRDSA